MHKELIPSKALKFAQNSRETTVRGGAVMKKCAKREAILMVDGVRRGTVARLYSEIVEAAMVQEEIKRIVAITWAVSMTATNASLVAKRAGTASVGFGVVARELRNFAETLGRAMQDLSVGVFGLTGAVAGRMQRSRRMGKLCAACHDDGAAKRYIADACGRSLGDLREQAEMVQALKRSLQAALARSEKQCIMGLAVARAAKIEAAYGGAHQTVLHHIAMDVDGTVDALLKVVRDLEAMMARHQDEIETGFEQS